MSSFLSQGLKNVCFQISLSCTLSGNSLTTAVSQPCFFCHEVNSNATGNTESGHWFLCYLLELVPGAYPALPDWLQAWIRANTKNSSNHCSNTSLFRQTNTDTVGMILLQTSINVLCFWGTYNVFIWLHDKAENLYNYLWKQHAEHTMKNSFAIIVKLEKNTDHPLLHQKMGMCILTSKSIYIVLYWQCSLEVEERKKDASIYMEKTYTDQHTMENKKNLQKQQCLKEGKGVWAKTWLLSGRDWSNQCFFFACRGPLSPACESTNEAD